MQILDVDYHGSDHPIKLWSSTLVKIIENVPTFDLCLFLKTEVEEMFCYSNTHKTDVTETGKKKDKLIWRKQSWTDLKRSTCRQKIWMDMDKWGGTKNNLSWIELNSWILCDSSINIIWMAIINSWLLFINLYSCLIGSVKDFSFVRIKMTIN